MAAGCGGDSGPTAPLVEVSSIEINPATLALTYGLSAQRTRVIIHRLEYTPCKHYPTCDGDYTCMRLITVDEVLNEAREAVKVGGSAQH